MKAKLLVVGGDVKATEIPLSLPAVLGRGREATITLPHPLVSRRHCELFESNGVLMVRDLGSLNGTYVGSQRVMEAPIPSGELLTVATVNLRAIYEVKEVDDETDAPMPVGNDDSTHGRGKLEAASASESGAERDQTQPAKTGASMRKFRSIATPNGKWGMSPQESQRRRLAC